MSTLDPVVLFFLLGLAAGLLRADLRLPPAIYEFLTIVLLLAIGLKGGVELANQSLVVLLPQMMAVVLMGIMLPLAAYPVLRFAGRLARADAASIAAHYGSVSVGTYAVAVAYLAYRQVTFERRPQKLVHRWQRRRRVRGVGLRRERRGFRGNRLVRSTTRRGEREQEDQNRRACVHAQSLRIVVRHRSRSIRCRR